MTGGLADVIITAEPFAPKTRRRFQDAPLVKDDAEMTWHEDIPYRVRVARLKGSLTIDNREAHRVTLGVLADNVRLATLSLAPEEQSKLRELKAGLPKNINEETGRIGWVRVTPYPSHNQRVGRIRLLIFGAGRGPS